MSLMERSIQSLRTAAARCRRLGVEMNDLAETLEAEARNLQERWDVAKAELELATRPDDER